MFTGIVAATGHISHVHANPDGLRLTITTPMDLGDVQPGDSIAVNGVCLTAVELSGDRFVVDVSRETLNCTAGLDGTRDVNLEKALRLADRLGGHLVSGHVDGVGTVRSMTQRGESWELVIRAPRDLAGYLARKGSVTVNGVSLTVNRVEDRAEGCDFSINLIPHTLEMTTLGQLAAGSRVNLEIDLIARYVERMLSVTAGQDTSWAA
ncbi:MAG: riboflavin synthase [Betaproteobacteria bacterium]|nr:riboflavin synthase [Betaproteobacteria bacterium]